MDVTAYLERIGVERPRVADGAALRELHRAHQTVVPFENLSIHLGEPISLAEDDLIDKIVQRRRGGFCYELNGAFAMLLEALGYRVVRAAARVYGGERLGPPFDHLALLVSTAEGGGPWLVDVGFGSHSVYPLEFTSRAEQADPGGRFALVDAGERDVDVIKDGQPQYRIERRARSLADFAPTCWWQQTSPDSHFTRGPICSRIDGDGRISISGRTLILTNGATRSEVPLGTDEALLSAYRDHFGIVLDRVPSLPRPTE
ncbi:arylamine N-acetyltransferase family protein [Micromonospora deserti]|uniref:Acetyltransferase n=1 Tax=Micromonospora deserti TaxID=2070366 RepID=A0A2W2D855_9ACTN|nr:arylamine N-acetyltransferase [Micromonospora deserti]PZG01625.1 acetyltransferase [Micromonospora deserti]